jgi:hypothetical protein
MAPSSIDAAEDNATGFLGQPRLRAGWPRRDWPLSREARECGYLKKQ